MKEPDFRDYHLLLDEQADVGATARSAEHADQQVASTLKNLPLKMMTKLVGTASAGICTTKVQFRANYPVVQFFRFAIATVPVWSIKIFDWCTRHERITDP